MRRYVAGDIVQCIKVSRENHEQLKLNELYVVKGASTHDGNDIYAVEGKDGKVHHSMDRFRFVAKRVSEQEFADKVIAEQLKKQIERDKAIKEYKKHQNSVEGSMRVTTINTPMINQNPNVARYRDLQVKMLETYVAKNKDYGNSVSDTYEDYGIVSFATRIADKYNRVKNIIKNGKAEVKDESIRDTFLDMANYCMLAIMEMDAEKERKKSGK